MAFVTGEPWIDLAVRARPARRRCRDGRARHQLQCIERLSGRQRATVRRLEPIDDQIAAGSAEPEVVTLDREGAHRSARPCGRAGTRDDHVAGTVHEVHRPHRVGRGVAQRQRSDGAGDRLGVVVRVDEGDRSFEPAEGAALTRPLGSGDERAGDERVDDRPEARDRRLVAACVQRERGVVVMDGEPLLGDDLARVDVCRHEVPGDAVLGRSVEQCPARDVEPGVLRQRTVVEVDREARPIDQVLGQDAQVRDAEQDVERHISEAGRHVARRRDHRDAERCSMIVHLLVFGRDRDDRQPSLAGDVDALTRQRGVADDHRPSNTAARSRTHLWVHLRHTPHHATGTPSTAPVTGNPVPVRRSRTSARWGVARGTVPHCHPERLRYSGPRARRRSCRSPMDLLIGTAPGQLDRSGVSSLDPLGRCEARPRSCTGRRPRPNRRPAPSLRRSPSR